jgi:hypothetical protein
MITFVVNQVNMIVFIKHYQAVVCLRVGYIVDTLAAQSVEAGELSHLLCLGVIGNEVPAQYTINDVAMYYTARSILIGQVEVPIAILRRCL